MSTMEQILAAREARADYQKELLAQYRHTLVCFTMNIPGSQKDSPLVRLAFRAGCARLEEAFPKQSFRKLRFTAAGPEAFYALPDAAETVKAALAALEEEEPIGRLWDMDVLNERGEKLSRGFARPCIVCGGDAKACAKAGTHSAEEASSAAERLLRDFAAGSLARQAADALLEEVRLTPKPGLVDAENSGSHDDMDISLFEKSAESLLPYFRTCVLTGMQEESCMKALQAAGLEAEKTMFEATGGVNTHKGAVYAFGLILGAMGSHLTLGSEVFSTAAMNAMDGAEPSSDTHGAQVRKKFRRCGARFEATEGFPNALSAYNILCENGNPYRALLWLIASVPDTNLLYRGGLDGLTLAQELAKKTQALPDDLLLDGIRKMDSQLMQKHLSPGGSADLLALGFFLKATENIWDED